MASEEKKPFLLRDLEARTLDGTGNNIANPTWGAAGSADIRITSNSYADGKGVMSPVDNLPTPRSITDSIMKQPQVNGQDVNVLSKAGANEFFTFFGQLVTHDIDQTNGQPPGIPGESFPLDGVFFGFTRNAFVEDANGVRQQTNQETSFLDLGAVYGHTKEVLDLLRADTHDGSGNLIQSARLVAGSTTPLPTVADVAADAGLDVNSVAGTLGVIAFDPSKTAELFAVGDERANQSPGLLAMQTIFMQNHNWHVDQLAAAHADWTQEQLFNAARALNEAEWQHVVYDEYLAQLVGKEALDHYRHYDSKVNPQIINEFASVAFRFGHDQATNSTTLLNEDGSSAGNLTLAQAFALTNAANVLRTGDNLADWVRGLSAESSQEIDGRIIDGVRNTTFGLGLNVDLEAIDIQRGRDHGTGNYNVLREGLGLKTFKNFDQFGRANDLDTGTVQQLKQLYGNDIGKLDSVVGGLLEKHAKGSMLGETFTKIIVEQFENLRDGDRFYYENRLKGSPDLLKQIDATSMADIIARVTETKYVYHDAFEAHQRMGGTDASETLTGNAAKNLIIGFGGDDKIAGARGDDDLYGGTGNDTLRGNAGDDLLDGEQGDDILYGGVGRDTFVFGRGSGHDKVMDFEAGRDRIDLSGFGFHSWGEFNFARAGGSTIIDLGGGDVLEITGVRPAQLHEADFILL